MFVIILVSVRNDSIIIKIINALLQANENAIILNKQGINAFLLCAMKGYLSSLKLVYNHLLKICNDKELSDIINCGDNKNGWTPYHLACMAGNKEMLIYLIKECKVDIQKRDSENKTGSTIAYENTHFDVCEWLNDFEHTKSKSHS